jgi:hypothetical protein
MPDLLRKLQHRSGDPIVVLGAPDALTPELERWRAAGLDVRNRPRGGVPFWLVFVRSPADVADRGPKVIDAVRQLGDPVVWYAYAKRTSPLAAPGLDRDHGWEAVRFRGWAPVRQVAIDADWSALRFRRAPDAATGTPAPQAAVPDRSRRRHARTGTVDPGVEQLLAALPPERQSWMRELHALIRAAAPELDVVVDREMIGYGRKDDTGPVPFPIGLSSRKRYVSIYLCAGDDDGYLPEANAARLGRVSVGRSCIRVTRPEHLDLGVTAELVRRAADLTA